jgi:TPP-dependent 2-oxoacid decarboxylase
MTTSQASGAILHHTVGNEDFLGFANMYKQATVS